MHCEVSSAQGWTSEVIKAEDHEPSLEEARIEDTFKDKPRAVGPTTIERKDCGHGQVLSDVPKSECVQASNHGNQEK